MPNRKSRKARARLLAPLPFTELRALPATVDLMTAARAIGLGRTKAYELAKNNQFPCRLLRLGDSYRVPTADLLRLLGIEEGGLSSSAA